MGSEDPLDEPTNPLPARLDVPLPVMDNVEGGRKIVSFSHVIKSQHGGFCQLEYKYYIGQHRNELQLQINDEVMQRVLDVVTT